MATELSRRRAELETLEPVPVKVSALTAGAPYADPRDRTVGPGSPNETLDDMTDDEDSLAVLHIPRLMRRLLPVVGEDQEFPVVSVELVQVV